jgi:tetratricopeptide (TPR) repeat protein
VTSRTSVLPYKGKSNAVNIRQMADELGVDNILEGSVRKSGSKLRITAQLIEARSDKHLWTEVYDREVTDVFEIQSEIAKAIAGKFNLVISRETAARLDEIPTKNMKAYELYLMARAIPRPAGSGIGTYYGSTRKGISYLKEAIKIDRDFGGAYVLMGLLYSRLEAGYDSAVLLTKEGIIRNPQSAGGYQQLYELTGEVSWLKRAYALDTIAGLLSYGDAFKQVDEITYALRCYEEARRKAPNLVAPIVRIGSLYTGLIIQDSIKKYKKLAQSLDPQSAETFELDFSNFDLEFDMEEWSRLAQRYYGDDSMSYYKGLGIAYLFSRKWKEAEAAYAKTDYRDMDVGLVLINTNREDSGRWVLQQSLAYHLSHDMGPLGPARIHAALGNRKEALSFYQKLGYFLILWCASVDPFTEYILDDPDFKKLVAAATARVQHHVQQILEESRKPFKLEEMLTKLE